MTESTAEQLFALSFKTLQKTSVDKTILVYTGVCDITAVGDLNTDENVRDFLALTKGKRYTRVHNDILATLVNEPEFFHVLNGGITLICDEIELDTEDKNAVLSQPSIINGAQTQGVIRDFLAECEKNDTIPPLAQVPVKIIVTKNADLRAAISVSLNNQNSVAPISIAGTLGYLDELDRVMVKAFPGLQLRTSETDLGPQFIDTERLIQVLTAMVPQSLVEPLGLTGNARYNAYSQKTRCLNDFQTVYRVCKGYQKPVKGTLEAYQAVYNFYLKFAPDAYRTYMKWSTNEAFKVAGFTKGIKKDAAGKLVSVSDGVVFPCLAALSNFIVKRGSSWKLITPKMFNEGSLVQAAKRALDGIAKGEPTVMGRASAAYITLFEVTRIIQEGYGEAKDQAPTEVEVAA